MDLTFFRLNPESGIPLYVQLADQIRHAIESCVLAPGDQLPPIRSLAQGLVLSPNTVVRVYTELQREGIVELRQGVGAFVVDQERHPNRSREIETAKSLVRELVGRLRSRGFVAGEIRRFLEAELQMQEERVRDR